MHDTGLITDLATVMVVAAATGLLAHRLGQPSILGYMFAGLLVGPNLPVPIFADPSRVQTLAELGVILVMFAIGLEFRISKLLRLLPSSGFTGVLQVSTMIVAGVVSAHVLGWNDVEAAFLGACLAISSTMVVSKVFAQVPVDDDTRGLVLGVLVLQDVVAIALITAMTAIAAGQDLDAGAMFETLGRLGGALVAMVAVGLLAVPRLMRAVVGMGSSELTIVVAIGLCFAVALLADALGYSVALGAFVAGVLVAESGRAHDVEDQVQPLRDVFSAVFFVSIGMTVDPRLALEALPVSLAIAAVVVFGQLLSVSGAGLLSGHGLRRSLTAGLSLGQIGEFSFILVGIGTAAGVVRPKLATVLVTVAVLTSFTTPLLLRRAERAVAVLDRRLPPRLQRLLSLYEEWFERLAAERDGERSHVALRALRAIVIDALALVAMLLLATLWVDPLSRPLRRLGLGEDAAHTWTGIGLSLLSLPLLRGLFRATAELSGSVVGAVMGDAPETARARRIGAQALRIAVRVAVLLGVGLPIGALLELLVGDAAALSWLLGIGSFGSLYVWRAATSVDGEFRSGAEAIAARLAREPDHPDGDTLSDPELIPGLDAVSTHSIAIGCDAVGATLAQLDLRARTGATVVAIRREGERVILPTGHEALQLGDVLALTGSITALEAAMGLLAPPGADPQPEPDPKPEGAARAAD